MGKIFKQIEDIKHVNKKNKKKNHLGSGSFSQVKLIYHRKNPLKYYAMKELRKGTKVETDYIIREIRLHKDLNHPNIIKFEDFLETKDKVFIFLEYAKNGDLFKYVKTHTLKKPQLLKLFYQTCLAIKYIHSKNIMHRDLKPENILLDSNLNIKICDFGWSAKYCENTIRATLCGTYEYMAPEIFFKHKQTKKTDIWSLGILLYELFHSHAPFQGLRLDLVIKQIMRNRICFKKSLGQDVKLMILNILIMDPRKRIGIEEILKDGIFDQFRGGERKRVLKRNLSSNLGVMGVGLRRNMCQSFVYKTKEDNRYVSDKNVRNYDFNKSNIYKKENGIYKGSSFSEKNIQNCFSQKNLKSQSFLNSQHNNNNSFQDIYSKLNQKNKKFSSSYILTDFNKINNNRIVNNSKQNICSIKKNLENNKKENLYKMRSKNNIAKNLFKENSIIKKKNKVLNPLKCFVDFKRDIKDKKKLSEFKKHLKRKKTKINFNNIKKQIVLRCFK